jgi:hypothetical protein
MGIYFNFALGISDQPFVARGKSRHLGIRHKRTDPPHSIRLLRARRERPRCDQLPRSAMNFRRLMGVTFCPRLRAG